MLDDYLGDSNFLSFYFKYFIKVIDGHKILDYSSKKGIIYDGFKSLKCDTTNINEYETGLFNGIVINNIDNKLDKSLFEELYSLLDYDGKILIIMHVKKVDKCFDDESEDEYIKELKEYISTKFLIEEELVSEASWKFIIILKNTIK